MDNVNTPTATTKLLIGTAEAADALSISTRKLWSLTIAGQIPSVKIGRRVLYSPDDLRGWIERQRRGRR